MSRTDGLALAWAVLLCLAFAGALPACWPAIAFPALYVAGRGALAYASGFLLGLLAARAGRR